MPLLVVPLGRGETGALTLVEWDALCSCARVLFERPDHPLAARLRSAGIAVGPFDDEPDARDDGTALVADPDSPRIVALARAGATITSGPGDSPDALTAAHGAPVVRRAGGAFADLVLVMARLRSDDGCPWDREQTHRSLEVHLLEEAHEVIDAIDRGATGQDLCEELGDVLLQVAFHARLAAQEGRFDVADVARGIVAKLLHRHPHVFGDVEVAGAHDVVRNWESIKAAEKARPDPFDGIPHALPALLSAYKVQKRGASLGWRGDESEARSALARALEGEVNAYSVGDALFSVVALARARGIDPEGALRTATERFKSSLEEVARRTI